MATRIATLVKAREDGTKKIVDMRRSGINALAQTEERIVLPKGRTWFGTSWTWWTDPWHELFTADFQDAFLNLVITEEERGHAIVLMKQGHFGAYKGVPFGLATAPLLWGRAAAFIGRCTQAVQARDQHRLQIYVDDPAIVVGGRRTQRTWLLGRTLILWLCWEQKLPCIRNPTRRSGSFNRRRTNQETEAGGPTGFGSKRAHHGRP